MQSGRRYVSSALAVLVLLLGAAVTAGVSLALASKERRSATAVLFVAPAATAEVPAVQDAWRAAGAAGLTLRPAAGVAEHYFAVYGRQLDGRAPAIGGADVAAVPAIADVLRQARSAGGAAMSNASLLQRETGLPEAERRRALNVATPVLGPGGRLRGLVLLGLRGPDFFGAAIGEVLHNPGGGTRFSVLLPHAPPARAHDVDGPDAWWRLQRPSTPAPAVRRAANHNAK
ncbi:CHASE domain-containing protein [Dactylosporangium sp. CA-139066]|uniref:CHASE domain-containing protein n=1 Tax=Dactylosporangium sp. CA-139066 TaxID=3239930 RepID=UPI003D941A30